MPAKKLTPAERDLKCLQLVGEGKTYDQVAKAVGYASKGSVSKAVKRALAAVPSRDLSPAEVLQLELHKMSMLEAALWPKARRGDLGAVAQLVQIGKRRDRVMGLNVQPAAPAEAPGGVVTERSEDGKVVPMRRIDKLRAEYEALADG